MSVQRPFRELIPTFLEEKLDQLKDRFGAESVDYLALARQYVRSPEETEPAEESNLRHYEAGAKLVHDGRRMPGIERLYRRTLVIEPTLACAAHCRYCIRANYPRHNLTDEQLVAAAVYCGDAQNRDDLTEVLITGGDVLLVPDRIETLLQALIRHAPNIRIIRIATRIPAQDPRRVNDAVLATFRNKPSLRFELATQLNHRVELFPEVVEALQRIMDTGARVYAQNVLLAGVNDSLDALVDLYDALRGLGIEPHYLFHCVPMIGMAHLRTPLENAIDLARQISNCGRISGRAKPIAAAMTDIGKIVLYDGAIGRRDGRRVLLHGEYTLSERLRWNPQWPVPDSAVIDPSGRLSVWYLDGEAAPPAEQPAHDRAAVELQSRQRMILPVLQAAG